MDEKKELLALAGRAIDVAKKRGVQSVAASGYLSRHGKVVMRDGELEEMESATSRGLSLRLFVDGRYGTHSTSEVAPERLDEFIQRAIDMTRLLAPDEHRALPEPELYKNRPTLDLGTYDADAWARSSVASRKARAKAAHDAAKAGSGDALISVSGSASDSVSTSVLVTSNGFSDAEQQTGFWVSASSSIKDPAGPRPTDYDSAGTRTRPEELDAAAVGTEAAKRALAQIGATDISSLTVPVIIENRTVARLLGGLLSPLGGGSIDQKQSCFAELQGKEIAAPALTIMDDPFVIGGWGSERWDGEGLSRTVRPIIRQGVLSNFLFDTYYGRKLAMPINGGSLSNVLIEPGKDDLSALMKRAGSAFLITSFLGGNFNSTTGDFSHGVGGFLVEDGKITRPVAGMNIAGNHTTFWKTLQAVGSDVYLYSSRRSPSLLFGPTLIAGK